jgi:DNA processing protein
VVVVEAGERGGALITAGAALEQGKSVFAVPGDIDRETARGCNLLLRDGAHPVLGPDDLVEALSLVPGLAPPTPPQRILADMPPWFEHIGSAGISVDDLAAAADLALPMLLADLGRLSAIGLVDLDGGRVVRGGRESPER